MKWLIILTVVILNPYQGLNYNEPNLYIISQERDFEIVESVSEGYFEPDPTYEPDYSTDLTDVLRLLTNGYFDSDH
jgi:hypothetical protein